VAPVSRETSPGLERTFLRACSSRSARVPRGSLIVPADVPSGLPFRAGQGSPRGSLDLPAGRSFRPSPPNPPRVPRGSRVGSSDVPSGLLPRKISFSLRSPNRSADVPLDAPPGRQRTPCGATGRPGGCSSQVTLSHGPGNPYGSLDRRDAASITNRSSTRRAFLADRSTLTTGVSRRLHHAGFRVPYGTLGLCGNAFLVSHSPTRRAFLADHSTDLTGLSRRAPPLRLTRPFRHARRLRLRILLEPLTSSGHVPCGPLNRSGRCISKAPPLWLSRPLRHARALAAAHSS